MRTRRILPALVGCLLLAVAPACGVGQPALDIDAPPGNGAAVVADRAAAAATPGPAARGTPQTAPTAVPTNADPAPDLARPDGASRPSARVAFVRGGDVYVLDTAAAVEERVTRDGQNHSPSWTADGQALLFERQSGDQQEVWLWRRGLAPTLIQSGLWSADGMKVALTEPGTDLNAPSTVVVEAAGRRTQVTPSEPDHSWQPLGWSSDGSLLALARRHLVQSPIPTYTGLYPADGALWLVDASGGSRREVLLPAAWGDTQQNGWPDSVRWAPSGQVLAVWVGPAMPCVSCRADGDPVLAVRVVDGSTRPIGSSLGPGFLTWMPSGEAIAVEGSGPRDLGRETYANKHLVRLDPATGSRHVLASDADFADLEPAVSPDSRWIAFVRGRAQPAQPTPGAQPTPAAGNTPLELIASRRLWLMQSDGSNARALLPPSNWTDEAPAWTPDGRWIAFVRWHAASAGQAAAAELWAARPDGSAAQRFAPGLDLPDHFNGGFGYYGALGFQSLIALAPRG